MTKEEVVDIGQKLYDQKIRDQVERGNAGRFIVIDIQTGEYQIDDSILSASDLARARNPDAVLYVVRIGSPAVYRIGHSPNGTTQ